MPDPLISYALGFDVALGGCSAAVLHVETGRAHACSRVMARGQSEALVPMIQDMVRAAGVTMADLGLVVTTIGPGGFTGLRIGLSTARNLGMALDVPVVGVRTSDILIAMAEKNPIITSKLMAVIETKREDFYVQESGGAPVLMYADEFQAFYQDVPITICGDGALRLKQEVGAWAPGLSVIEGVDLPDPVMIAASGHADFLAGRARPADPLYLRPAEVSVAKRPVRHIVE